MVVYKYADNNIYIYTKINILNVSGDMY